MAKSAHHECYDTPSKTAFLKGAIGLDDTSGLKLESHYREEYFAWQEQVGKNSALWNRFLWSDFFSAQDVALDFGCGGGFLLESVECSKKLGVEINPVAAKRARQRGIEVFDDIRQVGSEFVDKAITFHALEHVHDPVAILAELRRVLRPTGRLLVVVPISDFRAPAQRGFDPEDRDKHLYSWTPRLMGNVLYASGFRPLKIEVVTHCFPPKLAQQFWKISPSLFHAIGRVSSRLLRRRQLKALAEPA